MRSVSSGGHGEHFSLFFLFVNGVNESVTARCTARCESMIRSTSSVSGRPAVDSVNCCDRWSAAQPCAASAQFPFLVLMIFSCRLWFAVATGLCGRFPNCPFLFSSFIARRVSSLAASISLHPAVSVIHNFRPWREFFQRAASHPVTWAFSSTCDAAIFFKSFFLTGPFRIVQQPNATLFCQTKNPIHRLHPPRFLQLQSDEWTI